MKLIVTCGCGSRPIEVNDDLVEGVVENLEQKICSVCNINIEVSDE